MKRHAPATQRNRNPILKILQRVLPKAGTVLEIASGTGEHAVWFARHLPDLIWQPSDAGDLVSIRAWQEETALPNLRPPLQLDVRTESWPLSRADALFCANMVHIAPWTCCQGLFAGAEHLLPTGGPLILYGPFLRDGVPTAAGNKAFDESLRARDPAWGIRRLGDVEQLAASHDLMLEEVVEMPANNLTLVFRRGERA